MSLSGSVEDLPLLEILQVVSFCQKTGHLTVRSPHGEAGVVFDAGRVVSGYAWNVPALALGDPPAGTARERAVRERIAVILERLVRLRDGEFAFNLTQQVPVTLAGRDLSEEMLPYGINPEELMLDLAKKLDEDRRDAAAALEVVVRRGRGRRRRLLLEELEPDELEPEELQPEELQPDEPAAPAAAAGSGPAVLLVDDEPDVLRVVSERLAAAGFAVSQAPTRSRRAPRWSGSRRASSRSCWSPTWGFPPTPAPPSAAASTSRATPRGSRSRRPCC